MKTAFFILLFYLPFQIALNPAAGIDLASGRLFILILFFLWLADGFLKKDLKFAVNFQSLSFLLFFAAAVLSLINAENAGWGLRKIIFFASIFPIYFLAVAFLKTENDLKTASKSVSAAVLIASLFGIFQFFGQFIFGIETLKNFLSSFIAPFFWGAEFGVQVVSNPSWFVNIGGDTYFRAVSFFPDPHIFAFFLALTLPFIAANLWSSRNFNKLKITALIFGVIALFLTFSRGAYLGIIGAAAFAAFFLFIKSEILSRKNLNDVTGRESLEFPSLAPDENKFSPVGSLGNIKKIAAFGAAVLVAATIVLNFNNPITQRFYAAFNFTEGSNVQRIAIWKEALEIFKNNPLFGAGIGNYAIAKNVLADYRDPSNAHNLYLDVLAETGVFGLAAWLVLIFGTIWRLSLQMNNRRAILLAGGLVPLGAAGSSRALLLTGLVWFSIHSFFETAIYSPVILPLLLVYLAAALNSLKNIAADKKIR